MKKKTLFFLIPQLSVGGAEVTLINLLNSLDKSKYDITLCSVLGGGELEKRIPNDINYFYLTEYRIIVKAANFFYLKFGTKTIIQFLIRPISKTYGRFDFGICFQNGIFSDYLLTIKHKFSNTITVVQNGVINEKKATIYSEKYPKYKANLENRYHQLNHIVCVSISAKNEFETLYGNQDKTLVIPNTLNLELVKKLSSEKLPEAFEYLIDRSNLLISCLGRLDPVKNHGLIIDLAIFLIEKRDFKKFKFIIMGSGPLLVKLKHEINSNRLQENVILVGFVENPYSIINASDIFIQPSISEGLPTTVCEALAIGKPVVTSDIPSFNEVLDNGMYGLISKDSSIASFADNILKLRDINVRSQYAHKAKERAKDYSNTVSINGYNTLFKT